MTHPLRITIGDVELNAELNDSATARAVLAALPLQASAHRWGDEFYFSIPVDQETASDARTEMAVGELAYWPPGNAVCIFFGPTPASHKDEPRAASDVNPIGHVTDDIEPLKSLPDGVAVRLETA